MLKLKNISNTFLLILLMGSIHAFGQDPFIVFGQDISNNDTMRYISKAPHWQGVSKLTKLNYLQAQRKQFKASAYVETYVEAVLDHPSWMFTMFNQFAALGKGLRNTPHIIFHVRYKPLNDQLTSYQVSVTVSGSAELTLNFNAITQAANFLGLNGRTFPTPQDASDEVEQTIQEAMRLISREVGSSLSPNLMVKYNNEVFWNGHEILISKEGDNRITLQPLGKFGKPLSPEQVSWTNASNGLVDMTGLQSKSVTLTRLDTAASLTVNIKRRSSFVLDIKTLLRPIVLQVLEERLAAVLDELVNTRVDSVSNANSVASLVGQVEAGNVPLEGREVLVPLFVQPLVLTDSTGFKRNDTGIKARTLRELRRAKAIRQVLRTKVNTRAFCNLVIQKPDKLDELMDELLLNSGSLLGEIVLNLGDPAMLQSARNIIITYLNENMTRMAGSNFGMANDEPITVTRVQSATPVVFDPARRLYIANNVDFPGKEAFKNEMTTYLNALDTPLYVFVNYSQDVSTETYLKRTIGTRPAGLPDGAQFVTLTLVNIPGSVQYQVFGSKAGVQVNTSLSAKDFLIGYVKAKDEEGTITSVALEAYVKSFSLDESYYAVEDGLLPEYLWKSGLINPYAAGFVDGLWETIEGTWGIAKFLAAWQPNNVSEQALLMRMQTYQFVEFLNDLAKSPELRTQAWNSLKQSFSEYVDETAGLDNQAMYNQGKLIFDVITLFIGIGEIKAILNGQKVTIGIVALMNAVPKHLSKFVFRLKNFGLSLVKSGDNLSILGKQGGEVAALVKTADGSVLQVPESGWLDEDLGRALDEFVPAGSFTIETKGGSLSKWNMVLNRILRSNAIYKIDQYIFETDHLARVKKIVGELKLQSRGRNTYQQGKAVDVKDGLPGDQGGHLIAEIFYGPGEQINYLPMKSTLNQGAWKQMEGTWKTAIAKGKKVQIEISPIFEGSSKRPNKYEVEYWIDGEYEILRFDN
jgi:hypothetical protein